MGYHKPKRDLDLPSGRIGLDFDSGRADYLNKQIARDRNGRTVFDSRYF